MVDSRHFDNHLIIGGTIKAATSSLFTYLMAHPEVCGSKVKETYFFTGDYSGDINRDFENYSKYFNSCEDETVTLEASPNYLASKENAADRISQLLPETKIIFILRNPVDRLYSHYHFAKNKLQVPEGVSFDQFINTCEQYNDGKITPEGAGIIETHIRALEIGNYDKYLERYYKTFPEKNVKVMFFDDLSRDPVAFLKELCRFVNIDPEFYDNYQFNRANVTFSGQFRFIHLFALIMNRTLETFLRNRPGIKTFLVKIYKKLNQSREGYTPMSDNTRQKLIDYYAKNNAALRSRLSHQELPGWLE